MDVEFREERKMIKGRVQRVRDDRSERGVGSSNDEIQSMTTAMGRKSEKLSKVRRNPETTEIV